MVNDSLREAGRLSVKASDDTPPENCAFDVRRSATPVPYPAAMAAMDHHVAAMATGDAPQTLWLLEHPPLYTAGLRADPTGLLAPDRFPVYSAGRGGDYTYHGPGQRIGYVMSDLRRVHRSPRSHVAALECWLIAALAVHGIAGKRHPERIGVWVNSPHGLERKIAALGVRVRHGITLHGFALNIAPDLNHFNGIIPCGLAGFAVTSVAQETASSPPVEALDDALMTTQAIYWQVLAS